MYHLCVAIFGKNLNLVLVRESNRALSTFYDFMNRNLSILNFGSRVYLRGSLVIVLVRPPVGPLVRPSLDISETAH